MGLGVEIEFLYTHTQSRVNMNTQRGRWKALPEQMLRIRAKRCQKLRVHFNFEGKIYITIIRIIYI